MTDDPITNFLISALGWVIATDIALLWMHSVRERGRMHDADTMKRLRKQTWREEKSHPTRPDNYYDHDKQWELPPETPEEKAARENTERIMRTWR